MKKYLLALVFMTSISDAYMGCYDNSCTEFNDKKNEHGVVLASTGTQYKWVGFGVGSEIKPIAGAKKLKKEILYLGKSCDAYSKLHGEGLWEWANGGFIVKFKNVEFGFGHQELDIETDKEFGCAMK